MKKILSLLLSFVMLFSLVGCSTGAEITDGNADNSAIITDSAGVEQNDSGDEIKAEPSTAPTATPTPEPTPEKVDKNDIIDEDGRYFDKENVALYIHTYGKLPHNFITKDEARDLGWEGGSVEKYAPGYAIGGDRFGNYEGQLPKKKGRTYTECDIDTDGYHSRGSRRIVFSNDGLIYYTHDHYEHFELLYGEE